MRLGKGFSLLIVGAGDLGTRVGRLWIARHPGARVIAETRTRERHEELQAAGFQPRLSGVPLGEPVDFVLFAVPPSQATTDDLPRAVSAISARATAGRLPLLQISSTGVFAEDQGGLVTEDSPLLDRSDPPELLILERETLAAGGSVLRLAGLYDSGSGPHCHYLRSARSDRRPDGWINLIHRDDAARLATEFLERSGEAPARPALGCDGSPIRRADLARLAALHAQAQAEPGSALRGPVEFTGREGDMGKRCDGSATWAWAGLKPEWPSFEIWAKSNGAL